MCFILNRDNFFLPPRCLQCSLTRKSVRQMKRHESSVWEVKLTNRSFFYSEQEVRQSDASRIRHGELTVRSVCVNLHNHD